ncbi:hypothetical protein QQ045_033242 [Rhodiola kirilowii]
MALPPRQRTARESPQLATMILSRVTTATTAVEPTASHSGVCSSHLQSLRRTVLFNSITSLSIRAKLRCIKLFQSIGDPVSTRFASSSFTTACIRSLHLIAT